METPPHTPPTPATLAGRKRLGPSSLGGWNGAVSISPRLFHVSVQKRLAWGVIVEMSARVMPSLANGTGLLGKGCVGDVRSPGMVLCGTGRSSTPNTGLPV